MSLIILGREFLKLHHGRQKQYKATPLPTTKCLYGEFLNGVEIAREGS